MGSLITLGINGNEWDIYAPIYGYSIRIVNPFHFQKKSPTGYAVFDDGTARDVRICKCRFILSQTMHDYLIDYFMDSDKARGVNGWMRLRKNSGFTPFGPDKGDYGNFEFVLSEFSISGALISPYKHFSVDCTLIGRTYPGVTVPATQTDGSFSIGSVTGLRFPDGFPQPSYDAGAGVQLTRNGTGYHTDKLTDADRFETLLHMICSRSRAYALLSYLTGTVRTNSLQLTTEAGTYLFGSKNGTSGLYTCQWIDEELEVVHAGFNRYEFNVSLSLTSVA